MTPRHRWPATLVALALLSAAPGCRRADEAPSPSAHDDHDREDGDGHDHPHAEHVDPPHWPSDFPDAVERLLGGHRATRETLDAGRVDAVRETFLPIQRDLARWLPEVAADSDMPEVAWDRADALAGKLLAGYEAALADRAAPADRLRDHLVSLEPDLDALRQLREAASPAWFPPVPHPRPGRERASDGPAPAVSASITTNRP